jgi:pyruvate,water dikinase
MEITVSCAEGELGKIYAGLLKYEIVKTDLTNFQPPKTDIKMIAADPELAFGESFLPNRGVGLAR